MARFNPERYAVNYRRGEKPRYVPVSNIQPQTVRGLNIYRPAAPTSALISRPLLLGGAVKNRVMSPIDTCYAGQDLDRC